MDVDCIFCKIAQGEARADIVHRDDEIVAFRDIQPKAPLHVLVIPRRHVPSVTRTDDTGLIGRLVLTATRIATDAGYAERGFRIVTNAGPDGGQAVDHLHFHVLGGRPLGLPWSPWAG